MADTVKIYDDPDYESKLRMRSSLLSGAPVLTSSGPKVLTHAQVDELYPEPAYHEEELVEAKAVRAVLDENDEPTGENEVYDTLVPESMVDEFNKVYEEYVAAHGGDEE